MMISRDEFDPLGVAVDWLDAGKLGDLNGLLGLYDEWATLECYCERVILTGRQSLSAYWASKLKSRLAAAFTLHDIAPTSDGVQLDYQGYDGKPVRLHFRFAPSGKIAHSSCGPLGRRCAA